MSAQDDINPPIGSAEILAFPSAETSGAAPSKSGETTGSVGSSKPSRGDRTRRAGDDDPLDLKLSRFPMTDVGNAERFVERHKGKVVFCPDIGWFWWDGKRWSRQGSNEKIVKYQQDTIKAIDREAAALRASPDDVLITDARGNQIFLSDKLKSWCLSSQSNAHVSCVGKLAACQMTITVDELDSDTMKINVVNGTLHIAKREDSPYVELRPHNQADYITKISPVVYDPEARCPRFDQFMDEVHPPDESGGRSKQRFLDQWAGLSLTGDIGEQKLTFHYGKGRNGKGVWVNTIAFVGGDYSTSIPIESFLESGRARAGGQATPDLACLPGVRMLTTSEPKKGATLDEGLIKLFTGGDPIKARHLNKDFFSFTPQAKLTMQGNYRPKVSGSDEGIWSRLVLVPWGVFFPPEKRDPKLSDKLKLEASGILNRMLDGLCTWLDHGLQLPADVVAATADYRSDSDPLGRFLEACTRAALGKRVQASDMHAVFCAWAKVNGETLWSAKGLGAALRERGIPARKAGNVFWLDIELTQDVSDFIDDHGHSLQSVVEEAE